MHQNQAYKNQIAADSIKDSRYLTQLLVLTLLLLCFSGASTVLAGCGDEENPCDGTCCDESCCEDGGCCEIENEDGEIEKVCYVCDSDGDDKNDSCPSCQGNEGKLICPPCDLNDDGVGDSCYTCTDTNGDGTCYQCDLNGDGINDSCYVCDSDGDGIDDSCYLCDKDNNEVNDDCYLCDSDGNGSKDKCYLCDTDGNTVKDSCYVCATSNTSELDGCYVCDSNPGDENNKSDTCYQCDHDGNGSNETCWVCDADCDGNFDSCYGHDTNGDGIKDSCCPDYRLEICPHDCFAGRSYTTVGVGESFTVYAIDLTSNPQTHIAGANITIKSGEAYVSDLLSSVQPNTFTAKGDEGTVVFEADINGCKNSISLAIIRPNGVTFEKHGTHEYHLLDEASTGFPAKVWIKPSNVSFTRIIVREGTSKTDVDGILDQHYRFDPHPLGSGTQVSQGIDNKGSVMEDTDSIRANYTTDNNPGPYISPWQCDLDYTIPI